MPFKTCKLIGKLNCNNSFLIKQWCMPCLSLVKYFSNDCVKPWKVLFYGTDEFSETTLKALNYNRLSSDEFKVVDDIDIVCTEADCAVRRYASFCDITIHTWPFQVPPDVYDIGVVVSFGHLIPSRSICACKYGMINAHPSLLPRWRGAAPIVHTILNEDVETGVTITEVSPEKFDVGKIIMQKRYSVPLKCTSTLLRSALSQVTSEMVLKTLGNLPLYLQLSFPQPKEGVIYARKVHPEDGLVDWEHSTALSILRKFRAYEGFIGLYTYWKCKKIILLKQADPEDVILANISTLVPNSVLPGYCYYHKKRKILYVKCQDGWVGITSVKIPKRGKITMQDFYNGFVSKEEPEKCYFNKQL